MGSDRWSRSPFPIGHRELAAIDAKRKAVRQRVDSLERAIGVAKEYLQTGKHANWPGFRPLFGRKSHLPPHPGWVRNVYLAHCEKALADAEKLLQRLDEQ